MSFRNTPLKLTWIAAVVLTGSYGSLSWAASVKSVVGSKALLVLESEESSTAIGETFLIRGSDGAVRSTLAVTAIKGQQAMTEIKSGEVKAGDVARAGKVEAAKPKSEFDEANRKPDWTVAIGGSSDSQVVKLTSSASVKLSGTSPNLRVSLLGSHVRENPRFNWEAGAGFDQLKTSGQLSSASCKGSTACGFELLSFMPYARLGWLPFGPRFMAFQLRAGADLLIPITVNSNVIDYSTFNPLVLVTGGILLRPRLGKNRLYLAADAGYYVGTVEVTLTRFMGSVGYSWR